MATVQRFEELEVYKLGLEIIRMVWDICRRLPRNEWAIANQMKKAAVSIISNIAEGFERGSRPEFIQFCYIAKGSAGELRAQLQALYTAGIIEEEKCFQGRDLCLRESGALMSFITHLKGSKARIGGDKFRKVANSSP